MMMKKMTALFLGMTLTFSLMACGNADSASSAASSSTNSVSEESARTETAASSETSADAVGNTSEGTAETASSTLSAEESAAGAETAAETTPESGKTLVVYYSATGNTKRVAEDIAEAAGADLFEIVPTEVYTDEDLNWNNSNSRVSREHDDESLRDVPLTNTEVENWDSYDTVFIGYPIWWAIAAWPVDGFVKANDFTGKTVIPFATSASSGMGQSGSLLADLAGTGDWQEGQRFSSGVSTSDVQDWVNSLGLNQ